MKQTNFIFILAVMVSLTFISCGVIHIPGDHPRYPEDRKERKDKEGELSV